MFNRVLPNARYCCGIFLKAAELSAGAMTADEPRQLVTRFGVLQ